MRGGKLGRGLVRDSSVIDDAAGVTPVCQKGAKRRRTTLVRRRAK